MRIVVFSDSHNDYFTLRDIVLSQPSAEVFLHLGDGDREFEYLKANFPFRIMRGVRGNCDWGSVGEISDTAIFASKKIFFTHGHAYGVKSGFEKLKREAVKAGADIALFGHTHVAMTEYDNGIYYMNPGSVVSPQHGPPSYGVIDVTEAGIVTFIVKL